jgi:hypothetical protein
VLNTPNRIVVMRIPINNDKTPVAKTVNKKLVFEIPNRIIVMKIPCDITAATSVKSWVFQTTL